jgi:hypothetical protein
MDKIWLVVEAMILSLLRWGFLSVQAAESPTSLAYADAKMRYLVAFGPVSAADSGLDSGAAFVSSPP